ncbi:MAG: LamG domain-containing protein [Verrucomicrobiae bacterium]|nr:LamG domain-containing protein [Verrucomicrobiae bacterium]
MKLNYPSQRDRCKPTSSRWRIRFTSLASITIALIAAIDCPGQDKPATLADLSQRMLELQAKAGQPIEDLRGRYAESLQALLERTTATGDLKKALAVKDELEKFRTANTQSVDKAAFSELYELQAIYRRVLVERTSAANQQLLQSSEGIVAQMNDLMVAQTKASDLTSAQATFAEIQRINRLRDQWGAKAEVTRGPVGGSEALKAGLLIHYTFDQEPKDSRINDESGNQHDGSVEGVQWTAKGKVGGAFEFDGVDDRIRLAKSCPDLEKMTVGVWAYYDADQRNGAIYSDYGSANGNDLNFNIDNPKTIYIRADKAPGKLLAKVEVSGSLKRHWHQLVWTLDRTQSIVYLDGEKVQTIDQTGSNLGHHSDNFVGFGAGTFFKGMLDDFRIWDRVLSEDEIKAWYRAN